MITIKQLNEYIKGHPQFNSDSDVFQVLSAMGLERPKIMEQPPRDNPFGDSKVEYSFEDVCNLFG